MSYTSGQVGFAASKQLQDRGFSIGSADIPPQTESQGQRAMNNLASAISELDSRIDLLEKRINCAMVPQAQCDPRVACEKAPEPITSELVSTINTQRSRIDGLIRRLVDITANIDI